MKFVTAAAGRRDDYQVPIALAEAGLLGCHVTDFYVPDVLVPLLENMGHQGQRLLRRHTSKLPSRLVHASRRLAMRHLAGSLIAPLRSRLASDQDPISWGALRQARQRHAGLLLYAGYAYQAFSAEPRNARPRGLIQYHPHIRDSAAILRADAKRYPFIRTALQELESDEQDPTNQPELEIADLVICNSSFTAATCQCLGITERKLLVIPYGIDPLPPAAPSTEPFQFPTTGKSWKCRFLFVGSGIQRKGLHHLLLAWKQADLKHSQLSIVSRWIDPEIQEAIDPGDNVVWRQSVSNHELDYIYRQSDVFVLPSLIEGFGYVYLEAMARGCFCIGTPNTGLPDIGDDDSRLLVPIHELKLLTLALREAEDRRTQNQLDRRHIALTASKRSWSDFRRDVARAANSLLL